MNQNLILRPLSDLCVLGGKKNQEKTESGERVLIIKNI